MADNKLITIIELIALLNKLDEQSQREVLIYTRGIATMDERNRQEKKGA